MELRLDVIWEVLCRVGYVAKIIIIIIIIAWQVMVEAGVEPEVELGVMERTPTILTF